MSDCQGREFLKGSSKTEGRGKSRVIPVSFMAGLGEEEWGFSNWLWGRKRGEGRKRSVRPWL